MVYICIKDKLSKYAWMNTNRGKEIPLYKYNDKRGKGS